MCGCKRGDGGKWCHATPLTLGMRAWPLITRRPTLFPNGDSAIFFMDAVIDSIAEVTEVVTLTASAANFADAKNTLDVEDLPVVTLSVSSATIAEAAGIAIVTATLSAPFDQVVTVNLAFSGTAANFTDYSRSATQIVIPAGAMSRAVTLTAAQDTRDETNETIVVDISGVTNGAENGTQQVTVTINDDDPPPGVSLSVSPVSFVEAGGAATVLATLSGASVFDVTVDLNFSGTATNVSDYDRSSTQIVIPAGSATGTVTLTAAQDTLDETNETISVDITGVTNGVESGTQQITATINDDDLPPDVSLSISFASLAEAAEIATVTATLSAASGQNVTVNLAFSGTATNVTDYSRSATQIVIPAGEMTGTMLLTTVQDPLDEANETMLVDISGVTNGVESGTQQVSATIIDDDFPPDVSLSVSPASFVETSGTATVTATLSAASGLDVTIDLAFSGSATNVTDYSRTGTQIVIPAGAITGVVTLTAGPDTLDEADETILVDISSVTNGTESSTQQITATILDAKPLTLSIDLPAISELGGTATGTVSRGTGNTSVALLVNLLSDDASQATVPATVTILANASSATFTISAVNDTLLDGMQTVTVTAMATGFLPAAGAVDITDYETLSLSITAASISERGGTTTATVTRNNTDIGA